MVKSNKLILLLSVRVVICVSTDPAQTNIYLKELFGTISGRMVKSMVVRK